ncbi:MULTISPECIES: hypothetical protein [Nostoc]|uniref:Uncharacterized protein n=1 Tax=Nostoc paludosum FACHB-159 TaxID=2692908 RepID=A0ABR8KIJ7_9NOSO|nr:MULTISPECIES: hypothetical protein [Nostoc]MBD2683037.1 hypothetical protein [Nostoc sp. FACHB-857]MBD2739378.1 hypothetical protein [Nostoc paludosum FACHB-159]
MKSAEYKPPSESPSTPATALKPQKSINNYVEILAGWIVDLIAIPISFVTHIFAQFVTPGSSGTKILGAMGFFTGTLLSTDGIWQTFFNGVPLFPWFETSWIGWIGWLQLPFNPIFWLSFGMSALVQVMEAKTLRGKTPSQARVELEEHRQFTLGAKPTGTIDLTTALWGDYKRAGMKERHSGGLVALFFWVFDLSSTFISRNPFRYTNPGQILACFAYNIVTMASGEIGYTIWRLTK